MVSNLSNLLGKIVTEGILPLELDLEFYRLVHDDLKHFEDEELIRHFETYGRNEGRIASPAAHRVGFLATVPRDQSVLELGPFYTPSITGENVRYYDILDQEQLRTRARLIGVPDDQCPVIDFVSPTGDLSIVDQKFDAIVSSHCIEHQPNLVKHFTDIAAILNKGGRYYLLIPDKRFCFDHYLPESLITDVIAAYYDHRTFHMSSSVLEHYMLTTHNDAVRHWAGDHGDPYAQQNRERAEQALREMEQRRDEYIDVHGWQFTPYNFRSVVTSLNKYGFCNLLVERVYDTVRNSHEFMAILYNP
jgi:SAM-dependent methyltransferase